MTHPMPMVTIRRIRFGEEGGKDTKALVPAGLFVRGFDATQQQHMSRSRSSGRGRICFLPAKVVVVPLATIGTIWSAEAVLMDPPRHRNKGSSSNNQALSGPVLPSVDPTAAYHLEHRP